MVPLTDAGNTPVLPPVVPLTARDASNTAVLPPIISLDVGNDYPNCLSGRGWIHPSDGHSGRGSIHPSDGHIGRGWISPLR